MSTISTPSAATPSTVPTSPRYSTSTSVSSPGRPTFAVSPTSTNFGRDQNPTSSPATSAPSKSSASAIRKDKKGGSLFSFLSVKEPSAQAFEDYQNQIRKKSQGQKGRPTPVGMPGVSSAKLPPTVPKVNTKWDGVPLALKEREKEKEKAKDPKRLSVSAASSKNGLPSRPSQLSRSDTTHSTSSTGSGNRLADIYGWNTPPGSSSGSLAKDFALEHNKPKKTPSTTTLPETTLYATHFPNDIPPVPELPFNPAPYPELPQDSAMVPELHAEPAPIPELPANPMPLRIKPQGPSLDLTAYMRRPGSTIVGPARMTRSLEPASPPPRNPLRPPPVPELEGDSICLLKPSAAAQSPLPSPAEWSPVTPSSPPTSFPLPKLSHRDMRVKSEDIIKHTVLEVPTGADEVIVISSGVNVLGPPVSARRNQHTQKWDTTNHHPFLAGEAEELTLPTESPPLPRSILKKDPSALQSRSPARPLLSSHDGYPNLGKDPRSGSVSKRDRKGRGSEGKKPPLPTVHGASAEKKADKNVISTLGSGSGGTVRKKKGRSMFS